MMIRKSVFDRKLLMATDALVTSVIVVDRNVRILWCNTAAEALIGCSRRGLMGTDLGLLLPQVRGWIERLAEGQKQGTVPSAPLSAVTELERPLVESEPVHAVVSPMSGSEDHFLVEIAAVQDAMKLARQEQEMGLSTASRVLLRNLAHEIKNPLGGIRGAAQLLDAELASPEQREFTEVIIAEADRLQALVDRLLAPYRKERHVDEVNILEVLERVKSILLAEFPSGLTLVRDYDVSAPAIMGDREQLIQVFLNLVRNAAEAMHNLIPQGRAELILRTRVARQVTIQRKRYRMALAVNVIDNGPGIDSSIKEKIFYPLVTGKDGGSGLGLSLVQTYVEQHHGSIEVISSAGCTNFTLLFPYGEPLPGSAV